VKSPLRRGTLAALTVLTVIASLLFGATSSQATLVPQAQWVGTWGAALTTASLGNSGGSLTGFNNQSVRMIVRTSVGGAKLRIHLANTFGAGPVTVGHATVARTVTPNTGDPNLVPGSIRELTFQGSESVTMFKGADVLSDPIAMNVPALTELAVTLFFPAATGQTSWHLIARENTYVYDGDRAEDPNGAGETIIRGGWYFLAGVDVLRPLGAGSVLVYGDSISDGSGSTVNTNTRWPDFLAARIVSTPPPLFDEGVINGSLAGNQLTHDGLEIGITSFGNSALARLDADIFGQTDVRAVVVELGVNDLLDFPAEGSARIIAGLKQLAAQLEEHGLKTVVCTIGPFEGFVGPPSWSPDREAARVEVNTYIRSQHDFDAVLDMDQVLRDPAAPTKLLPAYDSGDHIHPSNVGAQALADAVRLRDI
jgi:lysophospholipase L1-like esterase